MRFLWFFLPYSVKSLQPTIAIDFSPNNSSFPSTYKSVYPQSNGECDFVDAEDGTKFDAKLLLTAEQGKLLGSRNKNILDFFKSFNNETSELYMLFKNNNGNFKKAILYQMFVSKIDNNKIDENYIFFSPFSLGSDPGPDSLVSPFCGDILSIIFKELRKNNCIKGRKIYVIYPSLLGDLIVLRCLNSDEKEYVSAECLNRYIKQDVVNIKY